MREVKIKYIELHPLDALKYKAIKRLPRKYKKRLKKITAKTSNGNGYKVNYAEIDEIIL